MAVERAAGGSSLIDVLDRVLDKGIVTRPALESRPYDELAAENQRLRAELSSAGVARQPAARRRRSGA